MAFTTWTAYKTQVLDSIVAGVQSGSIMLQAVSPMGPDGVARTFRNLLELERHVDWVTAKSNAESLGTDKRGRRLFLGAVQ
jgi:hypothetical protein